MTAETDYLTLVRDLIVSNVNNVPDAAAIQPEQMLYELGIDSLATVNLMVALSEISGLDLEELVDDIETPISVQDLCALAATFARAATTVKHAAG